MLELAFVMVRNQNWFFHDLVRTMRDELERQGIATSVSFDGFPPPRDGLVYALVPPHEYVALAGAEALPAPAYLARTVFVCAEQPETVHFADNVALAARAGATFDINERSVREMRRHGVDAHHLRVGHAAAWDHYDPERERDLDVVFLGCHTPRRSRHLSTYARTLAPYTCAVHLSDNSRPNAASSATFVADDEKWALLSRAKVLLNLHQGEEPYFEWLRALDAIHAGVVVVSEHSTDVAPLVPGRHFLSGRPESLALLADALLREPGQARLRALRTAAYELLVRELPFAASIERLAEAVRALATRPLPHEAPPPPSGGTAFPPRFDPPPAAGDPVLAGTRAALKDVRLDLLEVRRVLARLELTVRDPDRTPPPPVVRVHASSGWRARPAPRITVLTALYNHAELIGETLDSLLACDPASYEIVVVDDGSTDGSGEATRAWMARHDHVAGLLLRHPVNRGLGAARNMALGAARGTYCFVLDADNLVYPRCLPVLASALDEHPEVVFAYPIIEAFGLLDSYVASGGDPLLSRYGWEPRRLRLGNFVDAMAMVRTQALRELGGYATDRRLHGWEDYDLWSRVADRGLAGVHVPQMLARYRASPTSMLSLSNISQASAMTAIIERNPTLMAGIEPPL